MKIGDIDTDKKVLIIAEIGNNHEGSYTLAEDMIGLAAEAGAGAVKFQTFRTEHYVSKENRARFDTLKSFELTENEFMRLKKIAGAAGIIFLSTPFDLWSAEFLNDIVPAFKIASGDNTFYPLLKFVATFGKPIILSCGLADLSQLRYAKALIESEWARIGVEPDMAVLHCVTGYPVPMNEANLATIRLLKKELGCVVGYSDHTLGIEAAALSVALGSRIVEKHFTMDKNHSDFIDHRLSADPKEMEQLVKKIGAIEELMGSEKKILQECEKPLLNQVRRSIVASRDLKAGETIRLEDVTWTRPAGGISPGKELQVLGKTVTRNVNRSEPLSHSILK